MTTAALPASSLTSPAAAAALEHLAKANAEFMAAYPGDRTDRQPVHTVYGGAQLFKRDTASRIAKVALGALREYAPNFPALARAVGLRGAHTLPERLDAIARLEARLSADPAAVRDTNEAAWLAYTLYRRVVDKLEREAVEDFRIDFEDGYGNRPDAEEDADAVRCADELAAAHVEGLAPPFCGIRIKPFTEELRARSVRTLDLFVTQLARATGGRLPGGFVITLPKVTIPEQVATLATLLEILEQQTGLAAGTLKLEIMVETPQSLIGRDGAIALPALVKAGAGRCVAAHFGTYDYTAGCNITAAHQEMRHPACDFAKDLMQVALAGTGVMLSDGATNVMPIGPHRASAGAALSAEQVRENHDVVHRAWKLHYDDIRHSLRRGYYQGWDLHPAQLPSRYAAVYAFFLEGLEAASLRLKNFVEKAARATLVGDVFDDAATGQGLLNYFLRGLSCGAITEAEALATGLTLDELRSRSFVKILAGRRSDRPQLPR